MKSKLLKYIKTIIAITLIGTLALPTYATVGASDGSAFVTKAEFDAALSDFNARLTTFEAGINSKIDSQVSSYLDRNGIWQGKTQNIINTTFTSTDKDVPFDPWEPNAGKSWDFDYTWWDKNLIDEVTKSGMMVLTWSWESKTPGGANANRWGWSGSHCAPYGHMRSDSGWFLAYSIYTATNKDTDDWTASYSYTLANCVGTPMRDCVDGFTTASYYTAASAGNVQCLYKLPSHTLINTALFFVKKGNKIKMNTNAAGHMHSLDILNPQGNGIIVKVLEATVY